MSKQINVGIIGLGVGEKHLETFQNDKRCAVHSICDFDEQKVNLISKKYNIKNISTDANKLISNPEINLISIASFDNYHHKHIINAINNNKHIFVEKPICQNQNELENIFLNLKKNKHIKMSSNLILRKTKRFLELKEHIEQDKLGQIYYVEGDYDYGRLNKITNGWRGKIPYYSVVGGGAIHLIDLLIWLLQKKPKLVFSMANKIVTSNKNFKHNDFVASLLKFNNGLIAKITSNFGSVTPHHHKLCIYGSKGTFIQSHSGSCYIYSRDPKQKLHHLTDNYPGTHKGDMIPSFISSILDGATPEISIQEILDSMSITLHIEQSVNLNKQLLIKYKTYI